MQTVKTGVSLGMVCLMLSACATTPQNPTDPYESYNRKMFAFNQDLYTLGHPFLTGYRTVVPGVVQTGIRNVVSNVGMVPTIGNDLLQANFRWAGEDTLRLLLNTTLGCFGLFDIASKVGLYSRQQSFGLTLERWGDEPTPYIILPVFGPSTGSNMIGLFPDYLSSPVSYTSGTVYWPYEAVSQTQRASDVLPQYEAITQTAIDPYVAVRTAYLQNQALQIWQVKHENLPVSDAPMMQSSNQNPDWIPGEEPIPGEMAS